MAEKLSDQELARRAKLDKYKELGLDPFGQAYDQKNHSQEVKDLANKEINAFKEAHTGRAHRLRDPAGNGAPDRVRHRDSQ